MQKILFQFQSACGQLQNVTAKRNPFGVAVAATNSRTAHKIKKKRSSKREFAARLKFAILFFFSFLPTCVVAADTGFKNPSATGDDYNQWTNPENAYASDNSDAREPSNSEQQDWHNFSFGVPPGATIDGIQIEVEGTNDEEDNGVDIELSWDGGVSYTSTNYGAIWPESEDDSYESFGGSSDTWGRTWFASETSQSNFRVRLTKKGSEDGEDFYVDHIQAKVFYTAGAAVITATKTVAVLQDPVNGTTNPKAIPGAIVQYTIDATNTGAADADNCIIVDEIPANTTYSAGSMTLNSAPLTDISDGDTGEYDSGADEITVNIGTLVANTGAATVTFNVTID